MKIAPECRIKLGNVARSAAREWIISQVRLKKNSNPTVIKTVEKVPSNRYSIVENKLKLLTKKINSKREKAVVLPVYLNFESPNNTFNYGSNHFLKDRKTFVISYDLKQPNLNYSNIDKAIRELDPSGERCLGSMWIINYSGSRDDICNRLKPYFGKNDKWRVFETVGKVASHRPNLFLNDFSQFSVC